MRIGPRRVLAVLFGGIFLPGLLLGVGPAFPAEEYGRVELAPGRWSSSKLPMVAQAAGRGAMAATPASRPGGAFLLCWVSPAGLPHRRAACATSSRPRLPGRA